MLIHKINIIYYKYGIPYIYLSLLVHPCDKDSNGGCSQECKKKGDDAVCACGDGFILAKDGKACDRGKQEYLLCLLSSCITNNQMCA